MKQDDKQSAVILSVIGIRNAISIGGDSDTIAAITGSIAEAFYGADEDMKETALSYLDSYLLDIAESFVNKFVKKES